MAIIETKFSDGDVVYSGGSHYLEVREKCPDCLGSCRWTVLFADGKTDTCPCQTCSRGYMGSVGYIVYNEYQPSVVKLTIGQVRYDDEGARYMCQETGIGSGTVYSEKNLFSTKNEAKEYAEQQYKRTMANIAENNFKKRSSFADRLSTYGYTREDALKKEREMRNWIKLISVNDKDA